MSDYIQENTRNSQNQSREARLYGENNYTAEYLPCQFAQKGRTAVRSTPLNTMPENTLLSEFNRRGHVPAQAGIGPLGTDDRRVADVAPVVLADGFDPLHHAVEGLARQGV